jgi:hypothetical protein
VTGLERRVAVLEAARGDADLQAMTDEELDAYIRTLEMGTSEGFRAVLAKVFRHGSALPIVIDDPDY